MATYYARNVVGNWSAVTSWDAVSSGGAGPAGPPVAGDTAIFDSGFTGSITITGTTNFLTLTCQAGAAGTLTFNSGTTTVVGSEGSITFVSTMTLAGTGLMNFTASATVDMGGLSFPGNILAGTTITLSSDFAISGSLVLPSGGNYTTTFTGAYNVTCNTLLSRNTNMTTTSNLVIQAGQTLTVTNSMILGVTNSVGNSGLTIKSNTASSSMYLNYTGTVANCKVAFVVFTDIDASGSAQAIVNWHCGTLTRTENIYNITAASFPAVADVESGVEYGGVDDGGINRLTGTLSPDFPAAANVLHNDTVNGVAGTLYASNIGTALGTGSNLSAGILKNAEVVDDVTGTYDGPATDYPAAGNVRDTDTVDGVPGTLLSDKILKSNVTGSGAGNYDDDNLAVGNVRPVAFGLGIVGDLSNLVATDAAYIALENSRNNDNGTVAADIITTKSVKIRNTTINGTFNEAVRNIDPGEANVKNGIAYKILNVAKTGTYIIAVLVAHAKGLLLGVYK